MKISTCERFLVVGTHEGRIAIIYMKRQLKDKINTNIQYNEIDRSNTHEVFIFRAHDVGIVSIYVSCRVKMGVDSSQIGRRSYSRASITQSDENLIILSSDGSTGRLQIWQFPLSGLYLIT